MTIVFATNNPHKLEEIRSILGNKIEVLSLKDIGCHVDIPETGSSLEANAMQKAQYVYDHFNMSVFADDTGLEVDALDGKPGVFSARYASVDDKGKSINDNDHDSDANMIKLLGKLNKNNNRKAQFRTVIALLLKTDDKVVRKEFEGIVKGTITEQRRGGEGFGYDPIFQPDGYDKTFAELGSETKNNISHRAKAVQLLASFLKSL